MYLANFPSSGRHIPSFKRSYSRVCLAIGTTCYLSVCPSVCDAVHCGTPQHEHNFTTFDHLQRPREPISYTACYHTEILH